MTVTHDLVWGVKLHRRNYARKTCLQNPPRPGFPAVDCDRLAGLFEGVTTVFVPGVDDVARFDQPARGEQGHPALVVAPASVDEVRAVIRTAAG